MMHATDLSSKTGVSAVFSIVALVAKTVVDSNLREACWFFIKIPMATAALAIVPTVIIAVASFSEYPFGEGRID